MKETNNHSNKACSITKIKSKYILKQIFVNLKENKILETIRYNKMLKIKLDKNIKDYIKEYSKI